MKLFIDGDGLVYRCGFSVEKTKYLVETRLYSDRDAYKYDHFDSHKEVKAFIVDGSDATVWSRKEVEPVENALALVKGVLSALPEHTEREIWLTPSVGNFRERIAVSAKYKGNRETAARPIYYKEIIAYLKSHHQARTAEGEEADDRLGILAVANPGSCIVSFDKDLDQIPGLHYNWVTKELYEVSPKQASLNFFRQVLSGDPVDNVPGLPGIGPAKAGALIAGVQSSKEAWSRILEAYTNQFGPKEGPDKALETARLVWVRRKEGELWEPPA